MSKMIGAFLMDNDEDEETEPYAETYDEGFNAYWDGEPRSVCATSEAKSGWDDAEEEDE